ncbi:MAG: OFA family MFS transporter [Pirellulales bacterium]|nr:OFA family MFS transporter [Pirellulales bacterium]
MSNERVMNRWIVVVGALLIQLCLGAIYAWGTFTPTLQADKPELVASLSPELLKLDAETAKKLGELKKAVKDVETQISKEGTSEPLEANKTAASKELKDFCAATAEKVAPEVWEKHLFKYTATDTSWIFSAGLFCFALVMIAAGRWQDKIGPRPVALLGGIVLGAGYIGAAFTGTDFWMMFLLIGVVGGAGIGLGYVCPIAACVKWFPDMKGFITGMAVAGFGAGAFIFIKLGGEWANLIANQGVNYTFLVFGIIFLVSVVLGALMLSNPPAGWKPAGWEPPAPKAGAAPTKVADLTQGQCVQTVQFWMIWLAFVFSAGCGLMVIKCLKNFGINEGNLSAAAAGSALGLLALFNGLGRIVWGTLSQKLTARGALILMTLLQGGMMFVLLGMGSKEITLAIAACWIGFNFGGNFALFPLLTAESFGTKNLGANYGAVFTAYGIGGIAGPLLAGRVWDWAGSYYWAFIPAGVACLLAMLLGIALRPPKQVAA